MTAIERLKLMCDERGIKMYLIDAPLNYTVTLWSDFNIMIIANNFTNKHIEHIYRTFYITITAVEPRQTHEFFTCYKP